MTLMDAPTIYVNGGWRTSDARFDVVDPATGDLIGRADTASSRDVADALDAASAGLAAWSRVSARERSQALRAMADRLRAHADELAQLLTAENGKPLREAKGEIEVSAATLEWCAEEGRRVYGRLVPVDGERRGMVWRAPIGVVLAISPWNFPASMLVRKIGLALAAGCSVITKPSEHTPLIATALMQLFDQVGLPPGVINQLTTETPGPLVDSILADRRTAKVTFTGSTAVGRSLVSRSDGLLKSVSLELGGHAPGIVFEDADLDAVVEAAVASKFRNAGQSCTALNRLLVHESRYAEALERVTARVEALTVGPGTAEGSDLGPLITPGAAADLEKRVAAAVAEGATVRTGGRVLSRADLGSGNFFAPTVITDVPAGSELLTREIFGPVLPVMSFSSVEEAIHRANSTDYGLAAYLYGGSLDRLWVAAERLEFGVIGINDPFPAMPEMPFGGMKNSGLGREAGAEGIEAYLSTKAVTVGLRTGEL